jgi:hypothetical protein
MRLEAIGSDGTLWRVRADQQDPARSLDSGHEHWTRPTSDPDAQRVPAEYRQKVDAIRNAVVEGRIGEAERLARRLYLHAVAEHDDSHPYALRARELHAHTLLVGGDAEAAARAYIEVARVWGGAAYWGAAHRAFGCWVRIEDPVRALDIGQRLLGLLRLGGEEGAGLVQAAVVRLEELRGGAPG